MKSISLSLFAFAGSAIAGSHVHAIHRHRHSKRDVIEEKVTVTVVECLLDGTLMSKAECDKGIANGTLRWADDGTLKLAAPPANTIMVTKSAPSPTPLIPAPAPPAPAATQAVQKPAPLPAPVAPKPAVVSPAPSRAPPAPKAAPPAPKLEPPTPKPEPAIPQPEPPVQAPAPPPPSPAPVQSKPAVNVAAVDKSEGFIGAVTGEGADFPDGELPCTTFPHQFGALPLKHLGLGGWAGIQKPNYIGSDGYDDILTVTKSQCSGGHCCLEGAFCSYACGEGLLKFQWPSLQGRTGQSIGGIQCRNGRLFLTNPEVKTLCGKGSNKVAVYVKNTMSKNVAICRTNYPGDESMSIPLDVRPGMTRKLAAPDQALFWRARGKKTSAQYYINLPGYSVEKACRWGNHGDDFGNFAPGVLGVGIDNGIAYVSIFSNNPTQSMTLPYTITLIGSESQCRYQNGQWCMGEGFTDCKVNGCTVGSTKDLTYVLSD
ncbi:SUN-domain-containing protein [Tothia fuscella]|uniref:SUN-domain-containing protein n=1 Tax=Tothia fuscella TaxID=1048955 RepID=A0A9P4NZW2_9PEZI|nr:SUN-domain-containing protein [Tothia fuscella]